MSMTTEEATAILNEKQKRGRPKKDVYEKRCAARVALGFKLVGKKWVKPEAPKAEAPASEPTPGAEAPAAPVSTPVEQPAETISAGQETVPGF